MSHPHAPVDEQQAEYVDDSAGPPEHPYSDIENGRGDNKAEHMLAALKAIEDICLRAPNSNSLPNIAKIARHAIHQAETREPKNGK